MLGSSPNTKEIYSEFIASKAPDAASVADEVEAVGADEVTEKGTTVFPRNDDGEPVIWDYQLKGFMKDACGALRRVPGTLSSKCKAYKKVIDGTIFVKERSVAFQLPEGGKAYRDPFFYGLPPRILGRQQEARRRGLRTVPR